VRTAVQVEQLVYRREDLVPPTFLSLFELFLGFRSAS
jgi:hypothetical protein